MKKIRLPKKKLFSALFLLGSASFSIYLVNYLNSDEYSIKKALADAGCNACSEGGDPSDGCGPGEGYCSEFEYESGTIVYATDDIDGDGPGTEGGYIISSPSEDGTIIYQHRVDAHFNQVGTTQWVASDPGCVANLGANVAWCSIIEDEWHDLGPVSPANEFSNRIETRRNRSLFRRR